MTTKTFKGEKITIKKLSEKDMGNVKKFQDFINSFVEEDAQIMMNERISLKEERKWLKEKLEKIKKKKAIFLVAEYDNLIIGTMGVDLNVWRQSHVGDLGITVRNGYRGMGLGSCLVGRGIKVAKKGLKPNPTIITLRTFSTNRSAINFYKKLGFKKVAAIPKQIQYKDKLIDEIIMIKHL